MVQLIDDLGLLVLILSYLIGSCILILAIELFCTHAPHPHEPHPHPPKAMTTAPPPDASIDRKCIGALKGLSWEYSC